MHGGALALRPRASDASILLSGFDPRRVDVVDPPMDSKRVDVVFPRRARAEIEAFLLQLMPSASPVLTFTFFGSQTYLSECAWRFDSITVRRYFDP